MMSGGSSSGSVRKGAGRSSVQKFPSSSTASSPYRKEGRSHGSFPGASSPMGAGGSGARGHSTSAVGYAGTSHLAGAGGGHLGLHSHLHGAHKSNAIQSPRGSPLNLVSDHRATPIPPPSRRRWGKKERRGRTVGGNERRDREERPEGTKRMKQNGKGWEEGIRQERKDGRKTANPGKGSVREEVLSPFPSPRHLPCFPPSPPPPPSYPILALLEARDGPRAFHVHGKREKHRSVRPSLPIIATITTLPPPIFLV
jgi:hypothetical protein